MHFLNANKNRVWSIFLITVFLAGCNRGLNSDDPNVRMRTVAALKDEAILLNVIATNPHDDVRRAAVSKITNQVTLTKLVTTHEDITIRIASLVQLSSQDTLASVALRDQAADVRTVAVRRLSNQAVLNQVARTDGSLDIRLQAIEMISDLSFLAEIAVQNTEHSARMAAAQRVTNQMVLQNVLLSSSRDATLCLSLISRIDDQRVLASVAIAGPSLKVRSEALKHVTNQLALVEKLASLRDNDPSLAYRFGTGPSIDNPLTKISEQAAWEYLAKNAINTVIQRDAIRNLSNNDLLLSIAINPTVNVWVRRAAIDQLSLGTDLARLAQLAFGSPGREFPFERKSFERKLMALFWRHDRSVKQAAEAFDSLCKSQGLQHGMTSPTLLIADYYIRQSDPERISELIELLNAHENLNLAERFLNCGQKDLSAAAKGWATQRGYRLIELEVSGRDGSRPRWRSGE